MRQRRETGYYENIYCWTYCAEILKNIYCRIKGSNIDIQTFQGFKTKTNLSYLYLLNNVFFFCFHYIFFLNFIFFFDREYQNDNIKWDNKTRTLKIKNTC